MPNTEDGRWGKRFCLWSRTHAHASLGDTLDYKAFSPGQG